MESQNPWWTGETDEKFEEWRLKEVRWTPLLIDAIPLQPFSLNFLTGPRQVGKTTAAKILIHKELERGRDPFSIFYCQCDELLDFKELGEVLDNYISSRNSRKIKNSLIVLDEITFVHDWWRAIKSRIDSGTFDNDVILITGSSSIELLNQKEMFPGRRGQGKDFILRPLSFSEYARLSIKELTTRPLNDRLTTLEDIARPNLLFEKDLATLFKKYLITGGFPAPIEDMAEQGKIRRSTIQSCLDWIRGDTRKSGKNEAYMKETLTYLLEARSSPISWLSITKNTSITSPHTTQAYIETLQQMYVVQVLHHLSQEGNIEYAKNKKVHFLDPFIARALSEYTNVNILDETLAESVLATHLGRVFPTYYWRNSTEIDAIALNRKEQIGFEVKWGPHSWRRPRHIKKCFLLTKEDLHLFLSSIDWR